MSDQKPHGFVGSNKLPIGTPKFHGCSSPLKLQLLTPRGKCDQCGWRTPRRSFECSWCMEGRKTGWIQPWSADVSGMTRRLWPYDEIHLGREQMWLVGRLEHAETGWDATPHLWKLFHVLSGYILVQVSRVLGKDPETMTSLEPGCIFLNRYCSTVHQLKVTFFSVDSVDSVASIQASSGIHLTPQT